MFNKDFYPTPENVILQMIEGYNFEGKTVLEPSAGKGNIVDVLLSNGASVIACEKNEDLKKIVESKCNVIASDFLSVNSSDISHVDYIVMNPPFSAEEKHILHAWDIAPSGCIIISLCNLNTIKYASNNQQYRLKSIVRDFGSYEDLGNCFSISERKTDVDIALIRITKPGEKNDEFKGFFMEEQEEEKQVNGIMEYNFVRDLVNRYVASVKLFDKQLELGEQMNALTNNFYSSKLSFVITEDGKIKMRSDFKKDLQKSGWNFIFKKMNMQKYTTRGLRDDINKFVEKQQNFPFTMKNIYTMLELVIGTTSQRMDKALLEVFDKLTEHYHENRYNVEGWKTNSHYLINEKFILPYVVEKGWSGQMQGRICNSNHDMVEDMLKAMCYITGTNYDRCISLSNFIREKKCEFGKWYTWEFFEIKGYMKGTMHFKFKDEKVWGNFNQRIAKIKGYPLYESVNKN